MVAVAFGSIGSIPTSSTFGAGSIACPYPAGIVAGNPLILFAKTATGAATWTTPTTPTPPSPAWTQQKINNNILSDLGIVCYTRIASGSESGTLTVSNGGTAGVEHICILRYTGNNTTTPFGSSALAVSSSTSTTSPTGGVVTPGANDMVVRCYAVGQATASTSGTVTFPTGTAWTSRINFFTITSSHTNVGCIVVDKIAGTDTQTVTANAAGAWGVIDIVIQAPSVAVPSSFMPYFL